MIMYLGVNTFHEADIIHKKGCLPDYHDIFIWCLLPVNDCFDNMMLNCRLFNTYLMQIFTYSKVTIAISV